MNLGQVKTKVTQIIREYSNNGSLIGAGENADYLLSMNGFINDAQFELAAKRKIPNKAFPDLIDNSTADSKELEIELDLQMLIPYYVAGHVIIDENPSLAQFFLDEFATKTRKIKTKATITTATNVYGGFDCGVQ
ncbi:MAG: hypothetical protein K0R09_3444 [Clostridiales bacterium]|jgi:hypothetical protein|nr:hypothetical protein [Clostridiales bacterium]